MCRLRRDCVFSLVIALTFAFVGESSAQAHRANSDDGRAGVVFLGGWYRNVSAEVEAPPHRFDPPHPPVAVLTDGRTGRVYLFVLTCPSPPSPRTMQKRLFTKVFPFFR
jgi:hypothetical protein